MWQLVKDLVSGAAALFRFAEKKQDLNNSPEMQANAAARRDATIRDSAAQAVATDNLDEIRRKAAE